MRKLNIIIISMFFVLLSSIYVNAAFDYVSESVIRRYSFQDCTGTAETDQAGYYNLNVTSAGSMVFNFTDLPPYSAYTPVTCSYDLKGNTDAHAGYITRITDNNCYWGASFWVKDQVSNNFHMLTNENAGVGLLLYRDGTGNQATYRVDYNQVNYGDASLYNGDWKHIVITQNGSNSIKVYINGTLNVHDTTNSPLCDNKNILFQMFSIYPVGGSSFYTGRFTDFAMFNRTLDGSDVTGLYSGAFWQTAPEFNIDTKDLFDSSFINSTVTITNGTYTNTTNTTNGEITFTGLTGLFNITIEKANYQTEYRTNYNVTVDLTAYLTPYFRIINVDYSNYKVYNNSNYVRNLTYSINYTCLSNTNTTIDLYINNTVKQYLNPTCNNQTNLYSSNYVHSTEHNYNISFYLNTSYNPSYNNMFSNFTDFISDLYNPNITLNYYFPTGFVQAYFNVTLVCTDNVLNQSEYTTKLNGNTLFNGNRSNNYLQSNLTYSGLTEDNTIFGSCRDLFGVSNSTKTKTLYHKTIYLIDEINGSYFNLNCTSAIIYFDDNSTSYDFKAANNYEANFTSDDTSKLRIEIGYSDGSIINRYLDTNLIGTDDLRVCANKEGTTHYEQLIISSTVKPAILKSVFSDCIVAADYTRFAYQDTKLLKAFTIDRLYYLYTFDDDDNQILLASTDGSISSYMNIDTLEFQNQGYNINILGDSLTFIEEGNNIILYYHNLDNDNSNISLTITNMDTNAIVLTTSAFTNPNNWTVYFDYSTLSNVTNETLFSAEILRYFSDGTSDSFKRYFNIAGETGVLNSAFVMIISILLSFFGLTFTLSRTIFSWFGALIELINIALLSFSISTWYILLWLTINVIVLIYIILIMIKQNYPTISG